MKTSANIFISCTISSFPMYLQVTWLDGRRLMLSDGHFAGERAVGFRSALLQHLVDLLEGKTLGL
jgi:hypothetical protein